MNTIWKNTYKCNHKYELISTGNDYKCARCEDVKNIHFIN